jgi:hypothetical protein
MNSTIIPPTVLAAKRREREKQRQERQFYAGSILEAVDESDQRLRVASQPTGTP